jgi:hypothetical protein
MCKDRDPVAQRIHRVNAENMRLASFLAGLTGDKVVSFDISIPRIWSKL